MEFAFGLVPTSDLEGFARLIGQAEGWGFDAAYVPDQGFHPDPFVALASLATTLSRIRLGVAVTNPYTRHPVQIARAAGALANLSDGRFILGLGAGEVGGLRDRLGAVRAPFLPIVETAIGAIRDLLAGREVSVETPAFAIRNVRLEFEVGHRVPIYLATTAFEGFKLAGRMADGLILADITDPDAIDTCLKAVAQGAAEAGRSADDVTVVTWITTIVTDDASRTRDHLRRIMAMTVCAFHRDLRAMMGVDEDHRTRLLEALKRGGEALNPDLFPDELFDRVGIVGNAGHCIERLRAIEAGGGDQYAIRMPAAAAALVDYGANLLTIAERVIPDFR